MLIISILKIQTHIYFSIIFMDFGKIQICKKIILLIKNHATLTKRRKWSSCFYEWK